MLWLWALGACLYGGVVHAKDNKAGPPSAPLVAQLIDRLDGTQKDLRTLSAEFVQHNHIKLFKQELITSGKFVFERGQRETLSRLRWDYLAPDPSTLLLTGKQAFLKLPGRPTQVFDTEKDPTVHAIFDELELWLGNGSLRRAQADYGISSAGTGAAPRLLLVPRVGAPLGKAFSRVELRLDGANLLLKSLLLLERNGDEKEIVFSHMERNLALPRDAFQP